MPRQKFDLSTLPAAPNLAFEQPLWQAGLEWVAGIDEAGRGALAGPVAAGIVVLPNHFDLQKKLEGVQDSKLMSAKARQEWSEEIKNIAAAWQVGFASPKEIDEIGIVPATRLAIMRALEKLPQPPQHLLVDAIKLPDTEIPQTSLIKGDRRSLSIAAASILAKVSRDELMDNLANQYPAYHLGQNKGYGTAAHRQAIDHIGPCEIHRFSFAPVRQDDEEETAQGTG